MPVLVHGGDSETATQADLSIFALCALIDRRDSCRAQLNVLGFILFCVEMATWGLKAPLGGSCVLLCIAIALCIYALHSETQNLRTVQRELLILLRSTPTESIEQFFQNTVQRDE